MGSTGGSEMRGRRVRLTRRQAMQGLGAVLGSAAVLQETSPSGRAALAGVAQPAAVGPYDSDWLPAGVRSNFPVPIRYFLKKRSLR